MKKGLIFSILFISLLLITGCTKIKSVIYSVETGDKIKVKVMSQENYDFNFDDSDNSITFKKDGKEIAIGKFLDEKQYDSQMAVLDLYKDSDSEEVQVLGEGQKGNNKYIYFAVVRGKDYVGYNYLFMIKGSDTAFILGGYNKPKELERLFKELTIKKV